MAAIDRHPPDQLLNEPYRPAGETPTTRSSLWLRDPFWRMTEPSLPTPHTSPETERQIHQEALELKEAPVPPEPWQTSFPQAAPTRHRK